GFPRTVRADQTKYLTSPHREADIINGLERTATILFLQAFNLYNCPVRRQENSFSRYSYPGDGVPTLGHHIFVFSFATFEWDSVLNQTLLRVFFQLALDYIKYRSL